MLFFHKPYYNLNYTNLNKKKSRYMPCRNPTLAKCGGEAQHFQS
jgi:hypothetical protein